MSKLHHNDSLALRVFNKVKEHMNWTDEKTEKWFILKNPLLGDITPETLLFLNPLKLERWIDSLIDENTPSEKNLSDEK